MNKVKILALMATVVLLALLPVGLYALQPEAPHQFFGTAWLADGSVAPDGTVVDAWIDGEEVATTTVDSSLGEPGFYLLVVAPVVGETFSGKNVTFNVGGVATADSVAWVTRTTDELTLAALSQPPPPPPPEGAALTIGLFALNSSGQTGMATLTQVGDDVLVELSLSPGALNAELVHIHIGTCGEGLGGVDRGLTSFVGGSGESSTLLADATLEQLLGADHAINAHIAGNPGTYTACGNIGDPQPLPDTGIGLNMVMAAEVEPPPAVDETALLAQAEVTARRLVALAVGDIPTDAGAVGPEGPQGIQGIQGGQGDPGGSGPQGDLGARGLQGAEGESGGGALAIVALILAIVALVGVGGAFVMSRRS